MLLLCRPLFPPELLNKSDKPQNKSCHVTSKLNCHCLRITDAHTHKHTQNKATQTCCPHQSLFRIKNKTFFSLFMTSCFRLYLCKLLHTKFLLSVTDVNRKHQRNVNTYIHSSCFTWTNLEVMKF